MSAWFLDSELSTCFYHLVCLVFEWAACLSCDVAQAFQHDIYI